MTIRPWIAASLSVLTLAAWSPTEPPVVKRYRIDFKTTQTVDLSALGQGEQKTELSSTGFVSVTTADSAGGKAITAVLDSLTVGEGSPLPPEMAAGAKGTTWHGYQSATGKMGELKASTENPVAAGLEGLIRSLFPPVKPGTREGATWTDTTETNTQSGLSVRTVTNYAASGGFLDGMKVLQVAGASSQAMSGTQEGPQGSMAIEGTGGGTGTWFLGADGTTLRATYSGTQNLAVSGSFAPEPIPVKAVVEGTSTLLK
ncbi:MAG: hypothetical protein SGJ01_17080 [Gemmatimonadota bacterium]|nr:hypothetical protein [Gemmatimonadota bacterium]